MTLAAGQAGRASSISADHRTRQRSHRRVFHTTVNYFVIQLEEHDDDMQLPRAYTWLTVEPIKEER